MREEFAAFGRGTVDRRRRVRRGDGMVTPRRRVEVKEGGQVEVLVPGRSRLVPTHRWVTAQPDLFEPAYAKDERTRLELELLELRSGRRPSRRQTGTSRPLRLPRASGRGPWRLP